MHGPVGKENNQSNGKGNTKGQLFAGLSGIELPVPKYQFPPEYQSVSRLTYYGTFFNSIEINNSFYKLPMTSTIARWATHVPDAFRFTFKLLRDVTHTRHLEFESHHIEEFFKRVSAIAHKKGCVLVQFPPSLKNENFRQLEHLLETIQLHNPENEWKVAVEFRDKGWYMEEVHELLNYFHASLVIQDIPKSASPITASESDTIYLRFHGPTGNYRGSYADALLHEYADYVREWVSEGKNIYVYFNNTAGDAFNNAQTFVNTLRGTEFNWP